MSVVGVNLVQLNVPTAEREAARTFYIGFIGLKQVARPTFSTSDGIWLNAGGVGKSEYGSYLRRILEENQSLNAQ